jgi:hypothetical protein
VIPPNPLRRKGCIILSICIKELELDRETLYVSLTHVLSPKRKKAILRYFPCAAVDLGVSGWHRGIAFLILRWYDWDSSESQ